MDMLKHGVKWVTGTFVIIFCMWCYLICSNSVMFAYSYRLPSYANVSRSWKFDLNSFDGKPILYSKGNHRYPPFSFGFHSLSSDYSCYFILAIYIRPYDNDDPPAVVWCANQIEVLCDNDDATAVVTLDFTSHGDLVLRDMYGSSVWSSNTSGRSVKSMHLRHDGNLVLSNGRGEPIWESFNYPTDTLLFNQVHPKIPKGQILVSRNTSSDYSLGIYYASWDFDGIHGFINSDPPKQYGFVSYDDLQYPPDGFEYVCNLSCHYPYMRLDELGRLRWYRWNQREFLLGDVFSNSDPWDDCGYPTTCGRYGVCTNFSRCVCPASDDSWNYFKPNEAFNAESGCTLVTPLSCPDSHKLHTLIKFENLTYFDHTPSLIGTDVENCKIECLKTCSCKAVIFRYYDDFSSGNCTLPSEIFTLIDTSYLMEGSSLKRAVFIKVQNRSKKAIKKRNLVVPISSSLTALVLVTGVCYYLFILRRRRAKSIDCSQDVFVDTVTRFSYESLVTATQDFQTRLGRGGFGSVFEGTLGDGTKVAVKRLDSLGQGRKEFLAEVNTIGSVHHFNLVKLIGFCDDGLNRLLVYEYMCNGSLEKWIFNQDVSRTLAWNLRRRIIDGVASGLEYLHEHCNQNIIHFDIKPQNILLDKDFNVKISDFGLAKMVDRDHSQVVTIVRGTPGYMAPELITGRAISCKVDVYSFGVLVLEIVCGRKNFGSSEADCLTNLVKMKADGDQLSDLIDEHGEDMMQQHKEEVVNMMKIAIWCLQPHFIRPTMSMVVKVLQDLANMEPITDLSYLNMVHEAAPPVEENFEFSIRPTESLLSGPR